MWLARRSIRATALSSEGFQVLGLVQSAEFEADRAAPVFEYSSRLSRREIPVQVWLLQQGLLNGDVEGALGRLDGAMRVSERSRPSLYPILASAIAADDFVGPVRELFARSEEHTSELQSLM